MKLLRYRDLKASGVVNNRPTLRRWIEKEGFPPPLRLAENSIAWPEGEVMAWIASRQRAAPEPELSEHGDDPGRRERRAPPSR